MLIVYLCCYINTENWTPENVQSLLMNMTKREKQELSQITSQHKTTSELEDASLIKLSECNPVQPVFIYI